MKAPEGFRPMSARLEGELERRQALAARALNYHMTFLDDVFRALLPYDLVLLGAPPGIGKTDLSLSIAVANARKEVRAHYLALEAEPDEMERRTKYVMLSLELWRREHPRAGDMNYVDWYLGHCEEFCGYLNAEIDRRISAELASLYTFYRGREFGAADLTRLLLRVHDETDVIVIDHLHYVDAEDAEDENRAVTDLMKTIRDISLRIGKPIILVAHLRKRDERLHKIVPTLGDFHGSSNITKICTQAITLERAHKIESPKWYLSPTFFAVLKDRRAGAPPYVALCNFDLRVRKYLDEYTLGRAQGREWKPLDLGDAPPWARHHRPLGADNAPSKQAPLPMTTPPQPGDDVPHASSDPRFNT